VWSVKQRSVVLEVSTIVAVSFLILGSTTTIIATTTTETTSTQTTATAPYEFTVLSATKTMIGGYPYLVVKVQSDSNQTLTEWLWAHVYVSGIFFAPAAEFTAQPGATVTVDLDMTTDVGGSYSGYLYVMTSTQVHLSAGLAVSGTLPWLPESSLTTTSATNSATSRSSVTTTDSIVVSQTTTSYTVSQSGTEQPTSSSTSSLTVTTTSSGTNNTFGQIVIPLIGAALPALAVVLAMVFFGLRGRMNGHANLGIH
jgi:hypothetical protein